MQLLVPPDAGEEAKAHTALAAVATARLDAMPLADSCKDGTPVGEVLAAFVAEKRRVLRQSSEALTKQAAQV